MVPRKAEAEASKTGSPKERLVVVSHGWQSESTDAMVAVGTAGCNMV